MFKLRKLSKRHVVTVVIICGIYFLLVHLLTNPDDLVDNRHKIELIEESIKSIANQGQCQIPDLPVDSPEMLKFLQDVPPIKCGDEDDDWVECEKSVCSIKKIVISRRGKITCDFTDILRTNDYKIYSGETIRTSSEYILKQSDFVRAKCWADDGRGHWNGVLIGIRDSIEKPVNYKSNSAYLNVLMYGFDSLSRNAFIRKLPNSYKYLTEELQADVLKGYNIVGDGTPQALIPILTGFTELELPETRKRYKNSDFVNVYPMIWKEYEKYGYVTSFNEDVPHIGTFSYRLNGFSDQPTDHYMRTYYLAVEGYLNYYEKLCIGHQPRHKVMMDYTKNFMLKYSNTPKFIFSFHGELSHDSINLVGAADNDIKKFLKDLKENNILNNTVLIMMSDHGNRFAEVRNTLQGKQEERLPFFSFIFPDWFKKHHKKQYKNFKSNLNRLITPFDIHATLEDIVRLPSLGSLKKPTNSRSISLLDKIPEDRSCANAYIEPHWCACLNWKQLNDTSSEIVTKGAQTIVEYINGYTEKNRRICSHLTLNEIHWASKLEPQKSLLKFKQNKDMDGFIADLTSSTKISNVLYQIKITTSPGNAIYEASLTYDLNSTEFKIKLSDISRVNKYGDQARCIYENLPELRKYCYCNS